MDISVDKAALILRFVQKFGKPVFNIANAAIAHLVEALTKNFSAYLDKTIERCSNIKTLISRDVAIPLETIYVKTFLRRGDNDVTEDAFFAQIPLAKSIVILGSGGAGKTVFMRHLFLRLAHSATGIIPIFVELRGLNSLTSQNLLAYIYHTVIAPGATITEEQFSRGVKQGALYLMLDGFDEIEPDRRSAIENQILELQRNNPDIVIIISSRHDQRFFSWQNFAIFAVQPMRKAEVVALIGKLPYEKSIRSKFGEAVKKSLYDRHSSFLSNPLLTTMMLITYEQFAHIPDKMHIFYEQAFETLFFRHDTSKEAAFQRKHYVALAINEFKNCLSALCITTYVKGQYQFSESEVLEAISSARDYERLSVNPADFLKDLLESVCIFQRDGLQITFTHRSFQEYFSAFFISRNPAIDLPSLLDSLCARTDDNVISMTLDINRDLIERLWVLPRLQALTDSILVTDENNLVRFANEIIGKFSVGIVSRSPEKMRCMLHLTQSKEPTIALTITRLYPQFLEGVFNAIGDLAEPELVENVRKRKPKKGNAVVLAEEDNEWLSRTSIGEHFRLFRRSLLFATAEIDKSVQHSAACGKNLLLIPPASKSNTH